MAQVGNVDLVSPDDVRDVVFTEARRGYDKAEVNHFLDQVITTLEELGRRLRAASRNGTSAVSAADTATGAEGLHDPDGAAQRLLAAAQRTADTLVHEAESQASTVTAEAEHYADRVRRDADNYSASITGQADEQAALIRAAAEDEARRVAEQLRSSLVDEVADLEAARDALVDDRERLASHLETERTRLRAIVTQLAAAIDGVDELEPAPLPALSGASLADVELSDLQAPAGTGWLDEPDADDVDDLPGPAADVDDDDDFDDESFDDGAFGGEAFDDDDDFDDDDEGVFAVDDHTAGRAAVSPEADRPLRSAAADPGPAADHDDAAFGAFGLLDDDAPGDDDLDDELFAETAPTDAGVALGSLDADLFGGDDLDDDDLDDDPGRERSIFDIESERYGDEPTMASPVIDLDDDEDDDDLDGGGFLDELRNLDDAGLGPADDETDAALSAFFDQDDEDDQSWRRRFGGKR